MHAAANAAENRGNNGAYDPRASPVCADCGVVEAVNVVESKGDTNNVVDAVAGGLWSGVLGNRVGGGAGKDLTTIAGAVGVEERMFSDF